MLIALMQAHGIRRAVVSPGGTHNEIVAGLQYNGGFEMYSTVDERGAAYMAVGMAAETGEPVAVICTESVASRNYFPAMTEAHYRQLPILAITGVHSYAKIGHLHSQVIDRSQSPKDTFSLKVQLPAIKDADDIWESNVLINTALLELTRHGGGPVHIDLPRNNEKDAVSYSAKELCGTRVIRRYYRGSQFPEIPDGRVALFVGTHMDFSRTQEKAVDDFCAAHDAVVFCGHTSGYHGKYRVLSNLAASQNAEYDIFKNISLLVHIGGPAADERTAGRLKGVGQVWRVNPDGEVRDTFRKLSAVFEMDEESFFRHYSQSAGEEKNAYLQECLALTESMEIPIGKLPFSGVYAAAVISGRLPEGCLIHIGLSNSIRAWSMFDFPAGVTSSCNTGCRGIDGVLSAFLGASFAEKSRICFCVLGDLTFFYDMNSIGNRSLGRNVRILLVNDGGGSLFKQSNSEQYKYIGDEDMEPYIAAVGHFGNKSRTLVKGYAESLGFEYLTASDRDEFDAVYERFIMPEMTEKPMFFELFTTDYDERAAFDMMSSIDVSVQGIAKQAAKQILGQKGVDALKKVIRPNGK